MNVYRHASAGGNPIRKNCVVELDLDIEEDDLLPTHSHRQQMKPHTSEDSYPESDDPQDSLEEEEEEEGVQADSGLGSSSEKPESVVKVSDGIARFQQEILKAEEAKCRDSSWQKLKADRRGSVDSALDGDSDTSSIPPCLPPKERFKSEDEVSAPALPPKKKPSKKRISFCTEEVTVFGSDLEYPSSPCSSSSSSTALSSSSVLSSTSPVSAETVFYSQEFYTQHSSSNQKVSSLNTSLKNNKNLVNSQQNIINNKTSQLNYKQNINQNNNQSLKQNNVSLINANNKFVTKQNNICLERTRQIQPQTHLAPQYPPETTNNEKNDDVEANNDVEVTNSPPILPCVKDLANKFLPKEIPEPKPRVMLQKKQDNGEKIPEMLKVKKEKYYQVHSLTARSVSREFREGLRQGKPMMTDTIVKLPTKHKTPDFTPPETREIGHSVEDSGHVAVTSRGEDMTSRGEDVAHNNKNHVATVTVVYDSVRNNDLYPDGEYIRTPSPEHVGIPAGPLKMPMRRLESTDGYTSEDSNGSFPPTSQRHPPPRRKMRPPPVDKNVWA